jgi:hypothetical protein
VKELKPEDLCDTGLKRTDGSAVRVFSSQNARVVATHFDWMKANEIGGVAFQRFVTHTRDPGLRKRSDNVLTHVRNNAERTGRVFYVTYDVAGADERSVDEDIRRDWKYLAETLRVTQSAAYLKRDGTPFVQLWGFGFKGHPGTADEAGRLVSDLKTGRAGLASAIVIGGVPTGWRTLSADSKTERQWADFFRSFDVISPWSVGRFSDEAGADRFRRTYLEPDIAETRKLGLEYMPVVFPGFSWHNLMQTRKEPGKAILNQIPRRCGRFLWRQYYNVLEQRPHAVFAAMFDEVDEGTALFKLEGPSVPPPVGINVVPLDVDGCALPDDWYLRITRRAAQLLGNGHPPARALDEAALR